MSAIFLMPLAILFPLVEGTLAVRLLEGKKPVLSSLERISAGFILGWTLSAFIIFWAVLLGVPLTGWGFLSVHILLSGALLFACKYPIFQKSPSFLKDVRKESPKWLLPILFWMVLWTVLKILAGGYDIVSVPSYWDDNYGNWNMRARAFYETNSLLLDVPHNNSFYFGGRASGYPLTVYFAKVWMGFARGAWTDGAVNSISFFWFLALLGCVAGALRRHAGPVWMIVGTWALVSLPLVLVHGTNPYTDVFMGAHLFLALIFFWEWMRDPSPAWLHLFACASAAMVFVKNEALLIFLPPLLLLFACMCLSIFPSWSARIRTFLKGAVPSLLVVVPWTLFKLTHALAFGNNKDVAAALTFTPNPAVPEAIFKDLLYTGSFFILFPVFILMMFLSWQTIRRSALGVIVLFLVIVFAGEFGIYWFTDLADEAIKHTGFGRGMVHLAPMMVFTIILLLRHLFARSVSKNG